MQTSSFRPSFKNALDSWDIVLVDDEPDSLEVALRWLKLAGARVLTATNGREGLQLVRVTQPRLVITDLSMPEIDGWELQYELKQNPETVHIPVIALTAHAMPSIKQQTGKAGFIGHISKPLNPTKFVFQVLDIVRTVPELITFLDPH